MPWSVTAMLDRRRRRPGADRRPRSSPRASRRPRWRPGCSRASDDLLAVAEHLEAACRRRARPRCRLVAASMALSSIAPVDDLVDRRPVRGSLERVVALQPGQLDDLLDQAGRAARSRCCIRPAKRLHGLGVVGGVAAPPRRAGVSAPTGVFSSWLTLATKSRRIASTRRSRVRSSTSTSTSRELERRHPRGDVPRRQAGRAA